MKALLVSASLLLSQAVAAQAGSITIGKGCATTAVANVPTLLIPPPVAGECFDAEVKHADPGAKIYIFVSPVPSTFPRITGCSVYLDLNMLVPIASGNADLRGDFTTQVCVPKAALGVQLHAQALSWAAKGDGLSNGLELSVGACATNASIKSNFNGTDIDKGSTVWFNAVGKASDLKGSCKLRFSNVKVEFTSGNKPMSIDVPSSLICFDSNATAASTEYDAKRDEWKTVLPAGYTGNFFLAGAAFKAMNGLPGGIKNVRWSGVLSSCSGNVSINWKWAAAVYTKFDADLNKACVKPIDGSKANPYQNSHHAGTPECFTKFVTGGARGGGGSN